MVYRIPITFLSIMMIFSVSAHASLGGSESSVDPDVKALNGTRISMTNEQYTVHQITTSTGVVKEFVSPTGVVFGVSWKGRVHPDLSVILGTYFDEYQRLAVSTAKKKGHGPASMTSAKLHLEKAGHMRSLRGRAFDPSLIPSGLTEAIIQ